MDRPDQTPLDDQTAAPIIEAMREQLTREPTALSVPGHQTGQGSADDVKELLGEQIFKADGTELKGFDDRRERKRARQRAERLAAEAWGADHCFFSSNGSSLSNHAAVLCVAAPGDKVLVARNSHKSLIGSLIIGGVEPVFLEPTYDADWGVHHGVSAAELEAKLAEHADAKAVLLTSPGYYGVAADLGRLTKMAHDAGLPVVVDEAWGPHFAFHPEMPPHALDVGADITLGSIHKTMNGLTQASILLMRRGFVDEAKFSLCYDLFETTSPSAPILASIDSTRRQFATQGEQIIGKMLRLARKLRRATAEIPGLRVMGPDVLQGDHAAFMDETKVLIDVADLDVTGFGVDEWLAQEKGVIVELSDERHLLAVVTSGHDDASVDELVSALQELPDWVARERGRDLRVQSAPPMPSRSDLKTEMAMTPSAAFHAACEHVPLDQAVGRIAAEMVSPYPPGIPRVLPGERITQAQVDFLAAQVRIGAFTFDASDIELRTIRVVA